MRAPVWARRALLVDALHRAGPAGLTVRALLKLSGSARATLYRDIGALRAFGLSWGGKAEALSPPELRALVREQLLAGIRVHGAGTVSHPKRETRRSAAPLPCPPKLRLLHTRQLTALEQPPPELDRRDPTVLNCRGRVPEHPATTTP